MTRSREPRSELLKQGLLTNAASLDSKRANSPVVSGELGPAGQCIPEEKSTRTVQGTSKKQGAESCGTKAQRLQEGQRAFSLRPGSPCHSPWLTTNILLSFKKKAEEKEGSFELEPQLCSSDCSSVSPLLSKRQPQLRTTVLK